jgi:stage V sporulation protein AF
MNTQYTRDKSIELRKKYPGGSSRKQDRAWANSKPGNSKPGKGKSKQGKSGTNKAGKAKSGKGKSGKGKSWTP